MLVVTLRKLWAKKWMFFCMLLGCILLIASTISLPLYENAVFDKMLRDEFRMEYENTGEWPAKYYKTFKMRKDTGGAELFRQEDFLANMGEELGVTTKESVRFYKTVERKVRTTVNRDDSKEYYTTQLSMLSELGEHVNLIVGEMYSEDGYTEDGCLEVVITYDCMLENDILLGEIRQFSQLEDVDGELLKIKVVGVIEPKEDDFYWEIGAADLNAGSFVAETAFRNLFLTDRVNDFLITGHHCYLFEYNDLVSTQATEMLRVIEDEAYEGNRFEDILTRYEAKRFRISATLLLLQIPMLLLLSTFLYMISKQMYEVERNEIAVIKSRGSSGMQLFRMYFCQTGILVLLGVILGIPLGIVFLRMLGSASGFLEFGVRRELDIIFNTKVFIYLAMAVGVIIATLSLPAIKHSRVSIVHLKQNRVKKKWALWEICFLDIACLIVGWYGYHTYSRLGDEIAKSVILNEPLDPLLYISSSMLIVGLGLLFLRLLPLFVKLIYKVGQRFWSPAMHSSFLEIMQSNRKQHFVMLFLVLTISFGIYHATVAQTIMDNALANAEHLAAADAIIKEHWRDNLVNFQMQDKGDNVILRFYGEDYGQYEMLDIAQSYTKVYYDDPSEDMGRVEISIDGLEVYAMFIHSKDFGELTWVDNELMDQHYYTYLNLLADQENGLIISRNYAEKKGLEVGNIVTIDYYVYMDEQSKMKLSKYTDHFKWDCKVVGIVDYWPGYNPTTVYLNDIGEIAQEQNYLVVGNYSPFEAMMGIKVQPYEVWIDVKDDADTLEVSDWINQQEMVIEKYSNKQIVLYNTVTDPLLQGTNGVLTMEFIVMILLCAVGYLVYWIMSIRDREMLFGVLRAFGMHKGELFGMLALEQLLSGILTTFVAIGVGQLTSKLFAPTMLEAYSALQQVIPMELAADSVDLFRLYGSIGLVLVSCLVILITIVFRMNVAEALKLGED